MVQTKCKLRNAEIFLKLFSEQRNHGNKSTMKKQENLKKWQSEISLEY